jgi:hypothetical protein
LTNGAVGTDSVGCAYTTACGTGAIAKVKVPFTAALTAPAAPVITATNLVTNICSARTVRYSVPAAPAGSGAVGNATGYLWSFVGTGLNAVGNYSIDSGSLSSQVIVVKYSSNIAAATTDSIRCLYTSNCGNGAIGKFKNALTALTTPPAPATSPIIQTVNDTCGNRRYRYIAPALTTASTGAATGWLWSFSGTLGANAVVDSGSLTSQVVVMRFSVYTASATGDSAKVVYTSGCGNSPSKATKLTNVARTCAGIAKSTIVSSPIESMSVTVFPNPTTSNFNLQVITAGKEEVTARVLDMQGRFIKSVKVATGKTMSIGSELKAGAYFIEVRQGKEVKTTRVIKF